MATGYVIYCNIGDYPTDGFLLSIIGDAKRHILAGFLVFISIGFVWKRCKKLPIKQVLVFHTWLVLDTH